MRVLFKQDNAIEVAHEMPPKFKTELCWNGSLAEKAFVFAHTKARIKAIFPVV